MFKNKQVEVNSLQVTGTVEFSFGQKGQKSANSTGKWSKTQDWTLLADAT